MDPKQLSQLDPKLKEAYERVMKTSAAPTAPQIPINRPRLDTAPAIPAPPTQPQPIPTPSQEVPSAPHIISSATVTAAPIHDTSVSHGFIAENQKKNGGPSPVLYIILGLLFFIAYGLFWVKFFKLPVPFLP